VYNATTQDARASIQYYNYSGLFLNNTETENNFLDWTHVYIPLCTADNHWGNMVRTYEAGLTVSHMGGINVDAVLSWVTKQYNPEDGAALITGWDSGADGAALWSARLRKAWPKTRVVYLGDSQATLIVNSTSPLATLPLFINLWTQGAVKSWGVINSPVLPTWLPGLKASITAGSFSTDMSLLIIAGANVNSTLPFIIGRYSHTMDITQMNTAKAQLVSIANSLARTTGAELLAYGAINLINTINEMSSSELGSEFCDGLFASGEFMKSNLPNSTFFQYLISGTDHAVLNLPNYYLDEVNDVFFTTWIKSLLLAPQNIETGEC